MHTLPGSGPQRTAGQQQATGPHRTIAVLDAGSPGPAYHLAHSDPLGRPVVLLLPPPELSADPGFRIRFMAEATNSARLAGPAAAALAAVSPRDAEQPWVAYDCAPALPLPAALAANAGPLPPPFVAALGTALAATLLQAHAGGLVHAGISPAAVLLTPTGPRLTAYGYVRAASPEGMPRTAAAGLDPQWLPPEQQSGGMPRPLGDVYALGAVLAYAATGVRGGDPSALPEGLREVLADCLAFDPARRPRADELAAQLGALRAEPQPPEGVMRALTSQGAGPGAPAPAPPAEGMEPPTAVPRPGGPRPSRRALLSGLAFGVAGLAVGGGGVAAWRKATEEEPKTYRTTPARGAPPKPLWRYAANGEEVERISMGGDGIAVIEMLSSIAGVDVRTGKQLWKQDAFLDGITTPLGDGLLAVPQSEGLVFMSVRGGKLKGSAEQYSISGKHRHTQAAGGARGIYYFVAQTGSIDKGTYEVVAYDPDKRQEVWRTPLPAAYGALGDPLSDGETPKVWPREVLIPRAPTAPGDFGYYALDVRTGDKLWEQRYRGLPGYSGPSSVAARGGTLISSHNDTDKLQAYGLESGKPLWDIPMRGDRVILPQLADADGKVCYSVDNGVLLAIAVADGKQRWRSTLYAGGKYDTSEVVLSATEQTVFYSNETEIEALDARDGSRRWRFATVSEGAAEGGLGGGPGVSGQVLAAAPGLCLVAAKDAVYALPVD